MTTETALQFPANVGLPEAHIWSMIQSMGTTLVASRMLPESVKTPEAAAAIILKGWELGIPSMQSFSHIHVIKGKPTCSSELQLALLARGGVTWDWKQSTNEVAIVEFRREGFAPCLGEFTMDQAKTAGLLNNPTWKAYPGNMLRARAISNGARMIGPDLLAGMSYTPEELGARVNEEGQPLEVEATVVDSEPEQPANGEKKDPAWVRFLKRCGEIKAVLGSQRYYQVLQRLNVKKSSEVPRDDTKKMAGIVQALEAEVAAETEEREADIDVDGQPQNEAAAVAPEEPEVDVYQRALDQCAGWLPKTLIEHVRAFEKELEVTPKTTVAQLEALDERALAEKYAQLVAAHAAQGVLA